MKKVVFKDTFTIQESVKLAKQYIAAGKLSVEDFQTIKSVDPTPTNKFTGWIVKQWINNQISKEDKGNLKSLLEEFLSFNDRRKTKNSDIYQYKTFSELRDELVNLNNSGSDLSNKDLERDFEVIRDDAELLVISPHTHEASRKLGLSHFAYRDCGNGSRDSSWCTTYKAPNHFNDYYHKNNVTFYYIKVRSKDLQDKLHNAGYAENYFVTAIAVMPEDKRVEGKPHLDAYDGNDNNFKGKLLDRYLKIININ